MYLLPFPIPVAVATNEKWHDNESKAGFEFFERFDADLCDII